MLNIGVMNKTRNDKEIVKAFNSLVNNVRLDPKLFNAALEYDENCRKKYNKKMSETSKSITNELCSLGIKTLINSSYSAGVFVDDPTDLDLDIVILADSQEEFREIGSVLESLGFTFLETRNDSLSTWKHAVYTKKYESFLVELKIRVWKDYREHLFKIHEYLDKLPRDVRISWRYIRSLTRDNKTLSRKIKYIWYVYGAIMTKVPVDKEIFPMNIFY